MSVRCAIAPGEIEPVIAGAIVAGGGELIGVEDAEALIWTDPSGAAALGELLARRGAGVRWVQLPFAGVERFAGLFGDGRTWTSTKGAYAPAVAEFALALGLAGLRGLPARARARAWGPNWGRRLQGGRVTVVGGGGITRALLPLLAPFEVDVSVVRRSGAPLEGPGVVRVVGPAGLHDVLPAADLVVLTLALTPETVGIIRAAELALMEPHAWLVNVARGQHVVTGDLVASLRAGAIGGAALDVTDPEPLPAGHPLWDLDNCLITPHVANTWAMALPVFAARVRENVARFGAGEPLSGVVDPALGY